MLIQLTNNASKPVPKRVFYSYSHKDEELKEKLDEQLTVLKRDGFISTWDDRMIRPGQEWDRVIDEKLDLADIIMLLVSPAFLASEYCQDIEVKRAIERHNEGSARVIPIILKPIVWCDTPFSMLEALPSKGKPITSWTEIDEAFKDIVEKIRVTIIEVEFPRSARGNAAGLTGQWLLKIGNKSAGQNGFTAEAVVEKLKEITRDYSIRLLGVAHEQVSDGEKINIGHLLILSGTPEAYEQTRKLFEDKQLSEMLGLDVTEFRISYGSTIQTSSVLYTEEGAAPSDGEEGELLVDESEDYTPLLVRGLRVNGLDASEMNFVVDGGNDDPSPIHQRRENDKCLDYFMTSLAVKEDNLWVNLSAYESNRMLPKELEGTIMGRDMLAQDCLLKRFTASLLHPDHRIGRQYWHEVYRKAAELFGTAEVPLDTYQKVWVLPKHTTVYESRGADLPPEVRAFFPGTDVHPEDYFGFVVDAELDVKTETDLFALRHNYDAQNSPAYRINEFTLKLFEEMVLPVIHHEVNHGKNFALLRQIYHGIILAYWYKNHVDYKEKMGCFVDSNNPKAMNATVKEIRTVHPGNSGPDAEVSEADRYEQLTGEIDHVDPMNEAFGIAENRQYYNEYIRMYRNGLYKCARTHTIDGQKMVRMYFSGALDFRGGTHLDK